MGAAETAEKPPAYRRLTVSTALRADFADLETQLQQIFINHPKVPLVICGDLNCDMLKSPSFPARQHICDFLSDYCMHQLVTAPTFASGSLLDVCLVKNREYVRNCSVSYCHFSPHKFVIVLVDVPKQRLNPTVILSRSFKRLDVQSFNCDLLTVDWEEVYKETSVSEKWQAFLKSFMPVIDDHAPRKSVTIRNPTAPPVSAATRDLMSQRRAALRSSGRESIAYRELNRAIRSAVRRDRRVELRREIGERGPNKVSQLVMPLSENFQTKTKPIPTECQFGKPNTKPILYGLQKADICTNFLKS